MHLIVLLRLAVLLHRGRSGVALPNIELTARGGTLELRFPARWLKEHPLTVADLQLEIAKQYPDVDLGPGYSYEERRSYFTVGLSAAIPLLDRNQGPIAQAEARRRSGSTRTRTRRGFSARG